MTLSFISRSIAQSLRFCSRTQQHNQQLLTYLPTYYFPWHTVPLLHVALLVIVIAYSYILLACLLCLVSTFVCIYPCTKHVRDMQDLRRNCRDIDLRHTIPPTVFSHGEHVGWRIMKMVMVEGKRSQSGSWICSLENKSKMPARSILVYLQHKCLSLTLSFVDMFIAFNPLRIM